MRKAEILTQELVSTRIELNQAIEAGNLDKIKELTKQESALVRAVEAQAKIAKQEADQARKQAAEEVKKKQAAFEARLDSLWVDAIRKGAALANINAITDEYKALAKEGRAVGVEIGLIGKYSKLISFSSVIRQHLLGQYAVESMRGNNSNFARAGITKDALR